MDYKAWDLEPHQSCGPKYEYRKPSADFKGEPIYTTDYVDHGVVKPPSAFKPLVRPTQSEPFDAITTFTADFVPKHGGNANKHFLNCSVALVIVAIFLLL